MRYTMFVKRGSKRFSRGCGCCIFHEQTRLGFSADFSSCEYHYELGIDQISMDVAVDTKSRAVLGCGCTLEHDPAAGTYLSQCAECKAIYDSEEKVQDFV